MGQHRKLAVIGFHFVLFHWLIINCSPLDMRILSPNPYATSHIKSFSFGLRVHRMLLFISLCPSIFFSELSSLSSELNSQCLRNLCTFLPARVVSFLICRLAKWMNITWEDLDTLPLNVDVFLSIRSACTRKSIKYPPLFVCTFTT